ncbi:MAG: hypothetical protein J0L75_08255 [Spirochaetes bacterium]|nr:hypothetical protein [Spirochaetota bacterium]
MPKLPKAPTARLEKIRKEFERLLAQENHRLSSLKRYRKSDHWDSLMNRDIAIFWAVRNSNYQRRKKSPPRVWGNALPILRQAILSKELFHDLKLQRGAEGSWNFTIIHEYNKIKSFYVRRGMKIQKRSY